MRFPPLRLLAIILPITEVTLFWIWLFTPRPPITLFGLFYVWVVNFASGICLALAIWWENP
jgi:hypothetical protein